MARGANRGVRWAERLFPLTVLGTVVCLCAVLVYRWYAGPRADLVVSVAAAGGLVFVVAAVLQVLAGFLVVRSYKPKLPHPVRFESRRGWAHAPELPRLPALPWLEVEPRIEFPLGLQWARDRLEATHRCAASVIQMRLHLGDGFGLARASRGFCVEQTVRVAPFLGELDRSAELANWARGEDEHHPRGRASGDPIDMRPYVRGDPIRRVLWKLYARTGSLMVRAPERALDEERTVQAFLVSAPEDEAAAAAAWVSVSQGYLGQDWTFSAPAQAVSAGDTEAAFDAIAASRGCRLGSDLDDFVRHGDPGAAMVLFVPGRAGPWLERVLAVARTRSVTAVVATDEGSTDEVGVSLGRAGAQVVSVERVRPEVTL